MSSDPEDDALSWDGDDALEARRPTPRPQKAKEAAPSVEKTSDAADAASPASAPSAAAPAAPAASAAVIEDDDEPAGIGTASLLFLGVLGGVYLLYTIGWVLGGIGMLSKAAFMMPAPMYQAGMWVAVAAPTLWFAAALVLTRGSKSWVRFAALIVGALLLVPWPFVATGGGAL